MLCSIQSLFLYSLKAMYSVTQFNLSCDMPCNILLLRDVKLANTRWWFVSHIRHLNKLPSLVSGLTLQVARKNASCDMAY